MSDSVENLGDIERLAREILANLSPPARQRLLRTMARDTQASQRARIAAQLQPDGERFPPRKAKAPPREGEYPLKFLYPKGTSEPRLCLVKRWIHAGRTFKGYDAEVGKVLTFDWDKVARFLPVTAEDEAKPAGPEIRRGKIRARVMFRKLKGARYLKAGASQSEAWIGFDGRAAGIARVHQEGGEDKPGPNARAVRYARRQLLGLTIRDREHLLDLVLSALG